MYCACTSVAKAGILFGGDIGRLERIVAHDADRLAIDVEAGAGLFELWRAAPSGEPEPVGDQQIASGEGSGDDESGGLDAIGNDAMLGAVQLDRRRARGWWRFRRLRCWRPS